MSERGDRSRPQGVLAAVAVLAAALVSSSCPAPASTCQRAADCAASALCVEGQCRQACNASADCEDGLRCVQGACVPAVVVADAATADAWFDARGDLVSSADGHMPDATATDLPPFDAATDAGATPDVARVDASAARDVALDDHPAAVDAPASDGVAVDALASDAGSADQGGSPADAATVDTSLSLPDASTVSDAAAADQFVQLCGNWEIDLGEQCDDGDRYDDDGCSASCTEEPGWHCVGEPSRCCPDGQQDNDGDLICQPSCDGAGLTGCSGHGTCSDLSGIAICTCAVFFAGDDCSQCAVRVRPNGPGDGQSWALAEDALQLAVDRAASLAGIAGSCQVRLAEGVYPLPQGLNLKPRIAVAGGYLADDSAPEEADPVQRLSVLDGAGNARHVVEAQANSALLGVTIRGGNADGALGSRDSTGGGVLISSDPGVVIEDCTFVDNEARSYGAALALEAGAGAAVRRCRFVDNVTTRVDETVGGGAINVYQGSALTLRDSLLVGNASAGSGGALRLHDGLAVVERCVFSGNRALYSGGAIRVQGTTSTLTLIGSLLAGNLASGTSSGGNGGGLRLFEGSGVVVGSTVVHNQGFGEAGISFGTAATALQVRNVVAWGNVPTAGQLDPLGPDVAYCDAEGWTGGGAGNISSNPMFMPTRAGRWSAAAVYDVARGQSVLSDATVSWGADALVGSSVRVNLAGDILEYPVLSNTATTLRVLGNLSSSALNGKDYAIFDYRLQPASPAIDSGDVARTEPDLLGDARVCQDTVQAGCPDMGCYERPLPD